MMVVCDCYYIIHRRRLFFIIVLCTLTNVIVVRGNANTLVNVAFKKPTVQTVAINDQSNVPYIKDSSVVVDGNWDTRYSGGSCSHTATTVDNFLLVDLLAPFSIHSVTIINRHDDTDRLRDFVIYISLYNPLPLPPTPPSHPPPGKICVRKDGFLGPGGPHRLTCDRVTTGRYVYLWKPGDTGILSFCELEVMAATRTELGGDTNTKGPSSSPSTRPTNLNVFRVLQGKIMDDSPPFHSSKIMITDTSRPAMQCARLCLAVSGPEEVQGDGNTTTVVYLGKSGECQCVEQSRIRTFFDTNQNGGNVDATSDWTRLELDTN